MEWASNSLPVPLSPVIRTFELLSDAFFANSIRSENNLLFPIKSLNVYSASVFLTGLKNFSGLFSSLIILISSLDSVKQRKRVACLLKLYLVFLLRVSI